MWFSSYVRLAVVTLWLGLLCLLWLGPGGSSTTAARDPARLPQPGGSGREGWMGIYMNGDKVGYSHFELSASGDGHVLQDRSVLRLRMMERDQTVHAQTIAEVDGDYALRRFRVRLHGGIGQFALVGAVDDDVLSIELELGAETDRRRLPVDGPVYLPSAVRARFAEHGLRAGSRMEVSVFDPAALTAEPIVVEAVGRESLETAGGPIEAWRLVESFRGIETTVWLNDDGAVLREEGPMGLVAVREEAAQATGGGWDEGSLVDLMDAVAIPVRPPLEAPRQTSRIAMRLEGLGTLAPPRDGRQTMRGAILVVQREDGAAQSTFELPYTGDRWAAETRASAFVQSEHPRLRQTAERILAGERDARAAAQRLRRWVYANLEKRAVASIPNALQVLDMGAGDCNEHAVLFAALARAAGLPARISAGVVYADGVFLYHAWNEVWLGDGWVSVDPAFDQMPADATHVKLVEGEPDRHIELVPIIGKLSIEIIETAARG